MISRIINYLYSQKVLLLFACIVTGAFHHYFIQRTYVEIELTVTETTPFKVYWAKSDNLYSENNRARISANPAVKHYGFFLSDSASSEKLRIDPSQYTGEVIIHSILFTQRGYAPVEVRQQKDFQKLVPINDINGLRVAEDGLHVLTSGIDSQLQLFMPRTEVNQGYWRTVLECIVVFLLALAVCGAMDKYRKDLSYLRIFFITAGMLIIVMAAISAMKTHPDEYVHIDAATYYIDNWLPPAVDSPDILNTYSVYGVSRLNSPEVYYFLAGKFQACLAPLHISDYLAFRLFNVGLFFILLILVFHKKEFRPLALPLLVSSQIWYIFSYCNSDAFSLFICVLTAYQLVIENSLLNRYIQKEHTEISFIKPLLIGLLFGLLLLSKKNYYFFLLFAGGYSLWRISYLPSVPFWKAGKRLIVLALIGISFFGVRKGLDYAVNGPDRASKIADMRSQLATPLYNPNTPLQDKNVYLYMKARGTPLKQIITIDRWFEKTFRSSFGSYGYFTASATPTYYNVVRIMALAMFLFLSVSAMLSKTRGVFVLYCWTVFCASLLIGASLYHSWVADFQGQGRYLLGIVLMFGILFYHLKQNMNMKIFTMLYASLYFIALYSFICVGIYSIPKTTF